jgi:hypothetical protein
LLYYNARYYDPTMGHFISPDTLIPDPSDVFSYNRYLYALGNPLKYNDPSGHGACGLIAFCADTGESWGGALRQLGSNAFALGMAGSLAGEGV